MSTLQELEDTVAAYLQVDKERFIVGSVNLLRGAINRTRKRATKRRNWECERTTLSQTVSNGVGSLDSFLDGSTPVAISEVEQFYVDDPSQELPIPLNHHTQREF